MLKGLKPLIGLIALLYPVIIYFGLQSFSVSGVAACGVAIVIIRLLCFGQGTTHRGLTLVSLSVAVLLLLTASLDSHAMLLLYPVWVNTGFAAVFGYSLYKGPAMVTLIASLHETLDDAGVRYTTTVTWAWLAFFIANGSVAALTVVFYNEQLWLLYNGFVAYLLMGLFFLVEFTVRKKYKTRQSIENH